MPQPGWEPVGIDGEMWTATLKQGWTTGYVTDNPHLLLPVHRRFQAEFDRVEAGPRPGRRAEGRGGCRGRADHHLPRRTAGTSAEARMRNLAWG